MFEKVKAAVELVKKSHPYATKYKGVAEDEVLQILVALATEYLQIAGRMPEEYKGTEKDCSGSLINENYVLGSNSARHSCILAIIGVMPSKEEIETILNTYTPHHLIADKIHTLITNKIGGRG